MFSQADLCICTSHKYYQGATIYLPFLDGGGVCHVKTFNTPTSCTYQGVKLLAISHIRFSLLHSLSLLFLTGPFHKHPITHWSFNCSRVLHLFLSSTLHSFWHITYTQYKCVDWIYAFVLVTVPSPPMSAMTWDQALSSLRLFP